MTPDHVQSTDVAASRLLTEHLPYLESVALGIFFDHGSRDENPSELGASHLAEHVLFKGTVRRPARALAVAIESLGGSLDAFTARDYSGFYARFPGEHTTPAVELLGELVSEPRFDPAELEREKCVVYEEIKSARESPEDLVGDLLFAALYEPHPLGNPISGEERVLAALTRDQLFTFYQQHYTSARSVVVGAGAIDDDRLRRALDASLHLPLDGRVRSRTAPAPGAARVRTVRRNELSQAYVALALPTFALADERRYALNVLSGALGGGASSRLFQRLREEEGLVYSVSSSAEYLVDTGFLAVFFVTDVRNLPRVAQVLAEERRRLVADKLSPAELTVARNWTRGSLLLGAESPGARMARLARYQLGTGAVVTVGASADRYAAVRADEVAALIDGLVADRPWHVAAVGPVDEADVRIFM